MEECIICLDPVLSTRYAVLNGEGEYCKYHIECLQQWVQKSNIGCLTGLPVETYSIFDNDEKSTFIIQPEDDIFDELKHCFYIFCTCF